MDPRQDWRKCRECAGESPIGEQRITRLNEEKKTWKWTSQWFSAVMRLYSSLLYFSVLVHTYVWIIESFQINIKYYDNFYTKIIMIIIICLWGFNFSYWNNSERNYPNWSCFYESMENWKTKRKWIKITFISFYWLVWSKYLQQSTKFRTTQKNIITPLNDWQMKSNVAQY